jgi:hypothetical protein
MLNLFVTHVVTLVKILNGLMQLLKFNSLHKQNMFWFILFVFVSFAFAELFQRALGRKNRKKIEQQMCSLLEEVANTCGSSKTDALVTFEGTRNEQWLNKLEEATMLIDQLNDHEVIQTQTFYVHLRHDKDEVLYTLNIHGHYEYSPRRWQERIQYKPGKYTVVWYVSHGSLLADLAVHTK